MTHNNNGQEFWLMVAEGNPDNDMKIGAVYDVWQYHSDSTTITEEQAHQIVDAVLGLGYIFYEEPDEYTLYATQSYRSLLRSLGLEGKRIINLKKI